MTSETPIEQASKGAVKGFLDWSAERIEAFYNKIKNKEAWALQDPSIITLIKEEKGTPAWEFYSTYIQNPHLRFLAQLGLGLRRLEGDTEKLKNLRDKIVRMYGSKDLRQAEFVQSKILSRYIAAEIDTTKSKEDLTKKVEGMLNNIDRNYRFVKANDELDKVVDEVAKYIQGSLPDVYVLASRLSAIKICKKITDKVRVQVEDNYQIESISEQDEYVVFFRRKIGENMSEL